MSDGYVLRGRVWPPARRDIQHAVVYLHGIQSHGGWFEWSASLLAQHGCAVIMPDRRGSGLNQANRGDTPSRQRWLLDVDELTEWTQTEFRAKQLDVVGVSWGGKPALAWALERVDLVRRLLLIAPGLFPAVDVGPRERFRIGRALLTGGKRSFAIPLDDPELFTDNPAGQDFIRNDPLKLTRATARFLWHSRRLDRELIKAPDGVLQADTTLVLAGSDRIIRNEPTEAWLRRVGSGGVRTVRFDDAAHTLEFAADEVPYRTLLEDWAGGHD